MSRFMAVVAFIVALGFASTADAARVPSSRADRSYNTGARTDITVPYLTNYRSTLGVAQGVSAIIVASPTLNSPNEPTGRPVFNLIFYGSQKGSSPDFIHATQREANKLRPNK